MVATGKEERKTCPSLRSAYGCFRLRMEFKRCVTELRRVVALSIRGILDRPGFVVRSIQTVVVQKLRNRSR